MYTVCLHVHPLTRINIFTVTPDTFCPPSNIRKMFSHSPILINLATFWDYSCIRIGLYLSLRNVLNILRWWLVSEDSLYSYSVKHTLSHKQYHSHPESIQWFIDGKAFSRSYDFGSLSIPSPHSPASKLDRRHTGRLRKRDILLTKEMVKRVVEEPNNTKAWSSINHSILSSPTPTFLPPSPVSISRHTHIGLSPNILGSF